MTICGLNARLTLLPVVLDRLESARGVRMVNPFLEATTLGLDRRNLGGG